jgi:hypothetical protein
MGRNLGEKIRPSLETIAKKVVEKKSAYAESRSDLLKYQQHQHRIMRVFF